MKIPTPSATGAALAKPRSKTTGAAAGATTTITGPNSGAETMPTTSRLTLTMMTRGIMKTVTAVLTRMRCLTIVSRLR
jgi:hypothetical protein